MSFWKLEIFKEHVCKSSLSPGKWEVGSGHDYDTLYTCTDNFKESYTVLKYIILRSALGRDVLQEISGIPSIPTIVCG